MRGPSRLVRHRQDGDGGRGRYDRCPGMLVFAFYATAFLGLSDPATESPIKSNACEVTFRSATPHFIKAKPFVPKLLFRSVYGKLEYG